MMASLHASIALPKNASFRVCEACKGPLPQTYAELCPKCLKESDEAATRAKRWRWMKPVKGKAVRLRWGERPHYSVMEI